jgi:hypothetical protein
VAVRMAPTPGRAASLPSALAVVVAAATTSRTPMVPTLGALVRRRRSQNLGPVWCSSGRIRTTQAHRGVSSTSASCFRRRTPAAVPGVVLLRRASSWFWLWGRPVRPYVVPPPQQPERRKHGNKGVEDLSCLYQDSNSRPLVLIPC